MPAWRTSENPAHTVFRYDVLGWHAEGNPESPSGQGSFVRHVGLADGEAEMSPADVHVVHMRPPLRGGDTPGRADVVGRAELTDDEQNKVGVFVGKYLAEQEALAKTLDGYCVLPHSVETRNGDVVVITRFSCAGFVFEAYRAARITLLDLPSMPNVSLDTLRTAYPDIPLDRGRFRDHFGLDGDGPWPVMLPGYLLHALNRDGGSIKSIPHRPRAGEEHFPCTPES